MKKYMKFFKDHPSYTATTHAIGGLGLGFLLYGYFGIGTITWGWILAILALVMHAYTWIQAK